MRERSILVYYRITKVINSSQLKYYSQAKLDMESHRCIVSKLITTIFQKQLCLTIKVKATSVSDFWDLNFFFRLFPIDKPISFCVNEHACLAWPHTPGS